MREHELESQVLAVHLGVVDWKSVGISKEKRSFAVTRLRLAEPGRPVTRLSDPTGGWSTAARGSGAYCSGRPCHG